VENPQDGFVADCYANKNRIFNFVTRPFGHSTLDEYQQSLEAWAQLTGSYQDYIVEKMAWDGSCFTYAAPALFTRETGTVFGEYTLLPVAAPQKKR
jgi:hypothetical protein